MGSDHLKSMLETELELVNKCKKDVINIIDDMCKQSDVDTVNTLIKHSTTISLEEYKQASKVIESLKSVLVEISCFVDEKKKAVVGAERKKADAGVSGRAGRVIAVSPRGVGELGAQRQAQTTSVPYEGLSTSLHQRSVAPQPPPVAAYTGSPSGLGHYNTTPPSVQAPAPTLTKQPPRNRPKPPAIPQHIISVKESETLVIVITEVRSPNFWYFQPYANQDYHLTDLLKQITEYVTKFGESRRLVPPLYNGQLVIAKFYSDDCYYRARIEDSRLDVGEDIDWAHDHIAVYFIDYGNAGFVGINDMFEISKTLVPAPQFATIGGLFGVEDKQFTKEDTAIFAMHFKEKLLDCRIRRVFNGKLHVEMGMDRPLCLVDLLIPDLNGNIRERFNMYGQVDKPRQQIPPAAAPSAPLAYVPPPAKQPHTVTRELEPPPPPSREERTPHSLLPSPMPVKQQQQSPQQATNVQGVYTVSKQSDDLVESELQMVSVASFAHNWRDFISVGSSSNSVPHSSNLNPPW